MSEPGGVAPKSDSTLGLQSNPVKKAALKMGSFIQRKVFAERNNKQLLLQQPTHNRTSKSIKEREAFAVPAEPQLKKASSADTPDLPVNNKANNSKGAGASVYENSHLRSIVARERVTKHFETPDETAQQLAKSAHSSETKARGRSQLQKASDLKQVSASLSQHTSDLKQPLAGSSSGVEAQGRKIIDNLQVGLNHISRVLKQSGQGISFPERQELEKTARRFQYEQKLMLQVMQDPGVKSVGSSMTLQEAMELKRLGYSLNSTVAEHFSSLNDSQLIKGSDTHFGSGAIHSVTKLKYQTPEGVVEKIFKAEDPIDPLPFDSVTGPENYLDKSRPRFAARNFAAARFDKMLGADLMPKMKFTTHNGQVGLLMDVAKGIKPFDQTKNRMNWVPVDDPRNPPLSAKIQQQLNSAEWLDGICAQQDRHAGNLFIDPKSGKVTCIDNDIAFCPGLNHVRAPSRNRGFRRFSGSTAGLPIVIDASVHKKLMAITPQQIRQQMDGLLRPREIEATISRVSELQHHARNLERKGRVISNWQHWRDPSSGLSAAQLQRKAAPESYFMSVQGQSRGL